MKSFKLSAPLLDGKGFSLFELVAVLAIIGIVMALILGATHQIYSIYFQSEENWIVQQDVKNTMSWIQSNLETAYLVDIYPTRATNNFPADDDYYYIYYNSSDRCSYYRTPEEAKGRKIIESPVEVSFYYHQSNEKALGIRVSGYGLKKNSDLVYSMDTTKAFQNMYRSTYINKVNGTVTSGTIKPVAGKDVPSAGKSTLGYAIAFKLSSSGLSEMMVTTSGFCFIATAAYGSPLQPAVMLLRDFRDNVLLNSEVGKGFVNWYYKTSPPFAELISENEPLKLITRVLLVPVILIAVLILFPKVLFALLLSILLIRYPAIRKRVMSYTVNKK